MILGKDKQFQTNSINESKCTWCCAIPFQFETIMRRAVIRSEPQVQHILGWYYISIFRLSCSTKSEMSTIIWAFKSNKNGEFEKIATLFAALPSNHIWCRWSAIMDLIRKSPISINLTFNDPSSAIEYLPVASHIDTLVNLRCWISWMWHSTLCLRRFWWAKHISNYVDRCLTMDISVFHWRHLERHHKQAVGIDNFCPFCLLDTHTDRRFGQMECKCRHSGKGLVCKRYCSIVCKWEVQNQRGKYTENQIYRYYCKCRHFGMDLACNHRMSLRNWIEYNRADQFHFLYIAVDKCTKDQTNIVHMLPEDGKFVDYHNDLVDTLVWLLNYQAAWCGCRTSHHQYIRMDMVHILMIPANANDRDLILLTYLCYILLLYWCTGRMVSNCSRHCLFHIHRRLCKSAHSP